MSYLHIDTTHIIEKLLELTCAPVDQAVQSNIPTNCILVRDYWYIPWAAG